MDCYRKQHQKFCKGNPNRNNELKKIKEGRTHTKNEKMYEKHNFTCEFCKKDFYTMPFAFTRHKKHCINNPNRTEDQSAHKGSKVSEKTKTLWNTNGKIGGYRKNAGRGKRGYYKGIYCMSSWELAWVVYQLEHGKIVEQCKEKFEYVMNGKIHHYTPDFIINKVYYEIKNWHRPDTDFKINYFPKNKKLILIEGKKQNKVFLDYVEKKYGKNFYEVLYEKR
jgi:hypothetical protein